MDGEGIKLTRKRLQKTQAAMAAELEVSRQSYIAWEKDTYKIPADKLEKLLAMDKSVPAGGLQPKETRKQERERLAAEKQLVEYWVQNYTSTRAWPQYNNHRKAMALYASQGCEIPAIAHAAILERWPDILSDPDGDYTMTKEQSHAVLLKPPTTKD